MIFNGQVSVPSAGTAVRVGTDTQKRLYLFSADPGNTGSIAIGNSSVSMTNGLILANSSGPFELRCRLSELYVDAATNDDVLCWFTVEL